MGESDPNSALPAEVLFTYQKGNYYRMIHVDGAMGGLGPSGRYIHMSLWNERRTLPREQVYALASDGSLIPGQPPTKEVDIGGMFRELEVCAVLDIPVARALHQWLGIHLEKAARREQEESALMEKSGG